MPDLYALLVAVDTYPHGIPSLAGCVNDATAVEELLRTRIADQNLHLLRLSNEQAGRDAIIQSFRRHLGQAGTNDVALFFYAGHGSQVPTGGLFKEIEPDGMNESIVCYDSRVLGAYDLVDKDIATLIGELTAKGVHVTTIFDSCHSGSVTRDLSEFDGQENGGAIERKLPPRHDAQPAASYLSDPAAQEAAIRAVPSPASGTGPLTLATAAYVPDRTGLHVLLSACEDNQTAKEYLGDGKPHGAFTYFLTKTLQDAPNPLGYRELMHLVRDSMRDRVAQQTPKLESSGGDSMFDNVFLGLTPSAWTDYSIASPMLNGVWQLDRGSLMRFSAGDCFAIYPMSAEGLDLSDRAAAVAHATAISVVPDSTMLQIDGGVQLDRASHYKAVTISRAAVVTVSFEGDESGIELLHSSASATQSFVIGPDPQLRVVAKDGNFSITTGGADRILLGPAAQNEANAAAIVGALEHIATWKLRLELSNRRTEIPAQWVDFVITSDPGGSGEAELACPPLRELELQYAQDATGLWQRPSYTARITNKSAVDLYIALLVFSDDWSISTKLIEAGTQRLGPGETVYANSNRPIRCSVPPGAMTSTDDLLLVVCTDWFDALSFRLDPLSPVGGRQRGMDTDDEDTTPKHDFFTRRITFRTTRNAG
jgi:hypothetical protein